MVKYAQLMLLFSIATSSFADQLGIEQIRPDEKMFGAEMTKIQEVAQESALEILGQGQLDWAKKDELLSIGINDLDVSKPPKDSKVGVEAPKGENYVIFVSWSLGDASIKAMLKEYHNSKLVTLMFRGIPEGSTMAQALTRIQMLSREAKSDVNIEINPVTFSENGITHVPAVIKRQDENVLAIVRGTSSIEIFKERVNSKDIGLVGEVRDIAERDLIEVMQERMAKLDVNKLKNGAINRFWANQSFQDLDIVAESKTRRLDPTIVVPQEMRAPDGTLIHAAGSLINPLDIRPFNQRLVIINPSEKWQLTLARGQIKDFGRDQLVTIILTSVPRDSGWDELKEIESFLGQPAYILPKDVKDRFDLRAAPSVVTADTKFFYISETARKDFEQ
jgi:conjugal transfer pilus assembly protein TraW